MKKTPAKRSYTRRTEEERIQELEARLQEVKARLEAKKQRESPLQREWIKTQKSLRRFIQIASDEKRADLALSAEAFAAGLDRALGMSPEERSGRRRGRDEDDE